MAAVHTAAHTDGGDVVQIGYVTAWKPRKNARAASPYDSQVGGRAMPFGSALPSMRCGYCSGPMALACQVYAPAERERNLCVYVCPNKACHKNIRSTGVYPCWRVLRTQGDVCASEEVAVAPPPVPPPAPVDPDAWADAGTWGDDDGSWGDVGAAASGTSSGATSHERHQAAALTSATTAPATASAAISFADATDQCFPAFDMETCEEPYGRGHGWRTAVADSSDSESESEEDESDAGAAGASTSNLARAQARRAHAEELWRQYQSWEASEAAAATVEPTAAGAEAACSSEDDEERGSHDAAGTSKRAPGKATTRSSGRADEDGYEKVPAAVRYMLNFQKRIKRLPEQVARYCWNGEPLWPIVPIPPGKLGVSACACGAPRLFEMQLMPHMLEGIEFDELRKPAAAGGALNPDVLAAGIDFMTVLVYSCERSCDKSNEESAVIIPPT